MPALQTRWWYYRRSTCSRTRGADRSSPCRQPPTCNGREGPEPEVTVWVSLTSAGSPGWSGQAKPPRALRRPLLRRRVFLQILAVTGGGSWALQTARHPHTMYGGKAALAFTG